MTYYDMHSEFIDRVSFLPKNGTVLAVVLGAQIKERSMTTGATMVSEYIKAELAVLAGKTITFQDRSMGMENLQEICAGRREWEARASQESRVASCRPSIGGMSFCVPSFGDR